MNEHMHEHDETHDDIATALRDAATTFRPAPELAVSIRAALEEEDRPARLRFPRWRATGVASITLVAAALLAAVMLWPASLSLAEVQAALERATWIHMKYDDGRESWMSPVHGVSAYIGSNREYFSLFKDDRRWSWNEYYHADGSKESDAQIFEEPAGGGPKAPAGPRTAWSLYVAPSEKAADRGSRGHYDYERHEATVDDRRLVRFDSYFTDALGQRLLTNQLWADPATRLPVSVRRRLQLHDRKRLGREFAEGEFAFPEEGPTSIYDLGVPRDVPIVQRDRSGPHDDVRWVLDGVEAARRRFPARYRVLTWSHQGARLIDFDGRPELVEMTGGQKLHDYAGVGIRMECYLGLRRAFGQLVSEVPYEAMNVWIDEQPPWEQYVSDGERTFVQRGPWPEYHRGPETTARVNRMQRIPLFPTNSWPTHYQWPVDPRTTLPLERLDDSSDAPVGTVGIGYTSGDRREEFYFDPDRDFLCLRHATLEKHDETWRLDREVTLDRLVILPSGAWIARERRVYSPADPDHDPPLSESETRWAVDVRDVRFADDHFDIDALIENVKALGVKIESY